MYINNAHKIFQYITINYLLRYILFITLWHCDFVTRCVRTPPVRVDGSHDVITIGSGASTVCHFRLARPTTSWRWGERRRRSRAGWYRAGYAGASGGTTCAGRRRRGTPARPRRRIIDPCPTTSPLLYKLLYDLDSLQWHARTIQWTNTGSEEATGVYTATDRMLRVLTH